MLVREPAPLAGTAGRSRAMPSHWMKQCSSYGPECEVSKGMAAWGRRTGGAGGGGRLRLASLGLAEAVTLAEAATRALEATDTAPGRVAIEPACSPWNLSIESLVGATVHNRGAARVAGRVTIQHHPRNRLCETSIWRAIRSYA